MSKRVFAGTVILAISLALTGCGGEDMADGQAEGDAASSSQARSDESRMRDEEMARDDDSEMGGEEQEMHEDEMASARSGDFEGIGGKAVDGSVEVSEQEIVLSEFSSDEGPDLHVYLTNGSEAADVAEGVEIDVVAFDEASQTFALDGVDVADYDTVVIHCDKAKAVFGAAPLA